MGKIIFIVLAVIALAVVGLVRYSHRINLQSLTTTPAPTPTEEPFITYTPPKIQSAPSYTIFLVGDSMTAALGPNTDKLRPYLEQEYPGKVFGIFNYSVAATNILSLDQRLSEKTNIAGKTLPPILDSQFDVFIFESFGHNPLSQFSLEEGLKKQTAETETVVKRLIKTHPASVIIFLATISPNKTKYAEGVVNLTPEVRRQWAEERISYIKAHIQFAQIHNIPLINVYQKSLNNEGNGNLEFISSNDHMHPSVAGVDLISREIADFLYQKQILPN